MTPAFDSPMKTIPAFLASVLLSSGCATQPAAPASTTATRDQGAARELDLPSFTKGQPACLLVTDHAGAAVVRAGGARCAQRFTPFSTFKIPNSIIGLETGVIHDADTVIPWDRAKYPRQDWWPESWTDRDHDLRSAFEHSFVPYYRALATRVGRDSMQRYVVRFRYGNQTVGDNLDSFWLAGPIAISADEQVRFLRDFYDGKLGVSSRTTDIVKEILVRERDGDRVLSGKTGTGDGPGGTALGWIVGYVEQGEAVHFYAFNVTGRSYQDVDRSWRFQALKAMLAALGI